MNNAIIYIRVSTNKQVENGGSIDNQLARIKEYAKYNNLNITQIFTDEGISGYKKVKRPDFDKMMSEVNAKKTNHVIVYSLSRFARNTIATLQAVTQMKASNVTFHSVSEKIDTSSAMGELFLTILAGMAQMESRQISDRVTDVKRSLKSGSKRYSSPIFGFNNGKDLTPHSTEMPVVKQIFALHVLKMSFQKIATHLNHIEVATKENKQFYPSTISAIVKNPIYANYVNS